MKKVNFFMAFVCILGLSFFAYAQGAEKEVLSNDYPNTVPSDAYGFVIFNYTPGGTTDMVVQVQVRNATPNTLHSVYSNSILLGTFTTNKVGNGKAHFNLPDQDDIGEGKEWGTYINVWEGDHVSRILRAPVPEP